MTKEEQKNFLEVVQIQRNTHENTRYLVRAWEAIFQIQVDVETIKNHLGMTDENRKTKKTQ